MERELKEASVAKKRYIQTQVREKSKSKSP